MRTQSIAKTSAFYAILFGVTFFLNACGIGEKANIRNIVPDEIVLANEHIVEWSGSFDESQGFGLYQLSDATSQEITQQGLSFFTGLKKGKTMKWSYTGDWIMYEGPVDFSWITSNRARRLFDERKWSDKQSYKIYSNRTNHAGGIIVIPEINLVNVYYQS